MTALNCINFEARWLREISYKDSLEIQMVLENKVRGTSDTIVMGQEHPLVLTLGKRTSLSEEVSSESEFPGEVFEIDRGGLATIHGPGQLVIYPKLDLRKQGITVKDCIEMLLATTENTLAALGVPLAPRTDLVGVFTKVGKIAFIGVRVTNGCLRHGVSINVSNDLGVFDYIKSCGISKARLDRVATYMPEITTEAVFNAWNTEFLRQLELHHS